MRVFAIVILALFIVDYQSKVERLEESHHELINICIHKEEKIDE